MSLSVHAREVLAARATFAGADERSPLLTAGGRLSVMENHDQAYHIWRREGVRDRVLVHIDAHDDMRWIKEHRPIHIGNFICAALKEGLVKEVIWVAPDLTWDQPRHQKPLVRTVKKILSKYPGGSKSLEIKPGLISARLLGKPLRVCRLNKLPVFAEAVLLDIDIDYLVTPVACQNVDHYAGLPWCWPGELVRRLAEQGLRSDLATIVYSVEGGFTPLKWKYFGDELALCLEHPGHPNLAALEAIGAGAAAAHRGDLAEAEKHYLLARTLLPHNAALEFHLAHLCLDRGREEEARKYYQRAWTLDASYHTPYSSGGFWQYYQHRWEKAAREHRRTLALDPAGPYAYLGLGQLAVRKKRWREAESWLRQAVANDPQLVDGYRFLGKTLARQGRRREAIGAYENCLKLALSGHKSLEATILTNTADFPLLDGRHFRTHLRLARLYDLEGETETALVSYRMAIAAGEDGAFPRSRLACLHWRQGRRREALQEGWQALKRIPRDLLLAWQDLAWQIKFGFTAAYQRLRDMV